jgi:hypothetical protein
VKPLLPCRLLAKGLTITNSTIIQPALEGFHHSFGGALAIHSTLSIDVLNKTTHAEVSLTDFLIAYTNIGRRTNPAGGGCDDRGAGIPKP